MLRSKSIVRLLLPFAVSLSMASPASAAMAKYVEATAGDVIKVELNGKPMLVRIHGVVTPDLDDKQPALQRLGREAKAFLTEFLKTESWVLVEFANDPPVPGKDGAVPAYVYVRRGPHAIFVNEKLVGEGLAIVDRKVRTPFDEKLRNEEKLAREGWRGMWGSLKEGSGKELANDSHNSTYVGTHKPLRGEVSRWMSSNRVSGY